MKKQFYLFTERGETERFFCGNIYEALPTDNIRYHGCPMTFADCVDREFCLAFDTRKEANDRSRSEEADMQESNEYAHNAMNDEEHGYTDY